MTSSFPILYLIFIVSEVSHALFDKVNELPAMLKQTKKLNNVDQVIKATLEIKDGVKRGEFKILTFFLMIIIDFYFKVCRIETRL